MREFYTTEETADALKVRVETVRRWLRDGTITGRKLGKSWRIAESEIAKLGDAEKSQQPNSVELPVDGFDQLLQATRIAAERTGYKTPADVDRLIAEIKIELRAGLTNKTASPKSL
jgi:excisionase family DNA binding protein